MCVVNVLVSLWGDRARVRIYSDPFPVAAPPDLLIQAFRHLVRHVLITLITHGLEGRIGAILPTGKKVECALLSLRSLMR